VWIRTIGIAMFRTARLRTFLGLIALAAGCTSDHSRAVPRPSPTPSACISSTSPGAQHVVLTLSSSGPRPLAQARRGTVVTVAVSYHNEAVQVPKVYGNREALCLLGGSRKPDRRVEVRYLARHVGTVTISSGLAVATHADMPALFGTVRVR
jgi:hypothetical protein